MTFQEWRDKEGGLWRDSSAAKSLASMAWAAATKDLDWQYSKTGQLELWKNPAFTLQERLLIADAEAGSRGEIAKNLRNQLEVYEAEEYNRQQGGD